MVPKAAVDNDGVSASSVEHTVVGVVKCTVWVVSPKSNISS